MFIESYYKSDGHFNISKYCDEIKEKTAGKLFIAQQDIVCEDGVITAGSVVSIDARRLKNLGRKPQPNDVEIYIGVFEKKYAIEKESNNFEMIAFIQNRFQYHKLKDHKVKSIEVGLFWFLDYFSEALSEEESLEVLLNGFNTSATELCKKRYEYTNSQKKAEKKGGIALTVALISCLCFVFCLLIPGLGIEHMPALNTICHLLAFVFLIATVVSAILFAKKGILAKQFETMINSIDTEISSNEKSLVDNLAALFSEIEHYHMSQTSTSEPSRSLQQNSQ